jgi:hypothetical protein
MLSGAPVTVSDRVLVTAVPTLSLTCTVTENVPEAEGVTLMTPEGLTVRPASVLETNDHV